MQRQAPTCRVLRAHGVPQGNDGRHDDHHALDAVANAVADRRDARQNHVGQLLVGVEANAGGDQPLAQLRARRLVQPLRARQCGGGGEPGAGGGLRMMPARLAPRMPRPCTLAPRTALHHPPPAVCSTPAPPRTNAESLLGSSGAPSITRLMGSSMKKDMMVMTWGQR